MTQKTKHRTVGWAAIVTVLISVAGCNKPVTDIRGSVPQASDGEPFSISDVQTGIMKACVRRG